MSDTRAFLVDYVKSGSEAAFRELVSRYIDLVYSTALRQVGGDRHLAQDVAQMVFCNLARKARHLPTEVLLGGWLHRDTCHIAATLMRSQRRRVAREKFAVEMNHLNQSSEGNLAVVGPLLDTAINELGTEDRTAILLRFFEQRDFRSVADELGSSEDAARMRVNRALEKLHTMLTSRGFTLTTTTLAAGLGVEAVTAAPAGLAASVAGMVLTSATTAGLAVSTVKTLGFAHFKVAAVGIVALGTLATPLLIQHQSLVSLRAERDQLGQRLAQFSILEVENQRLSKLLVEATNSQALGKVELSELLRLRSEIGQLRSANKSLVAAQRSALEPPEQGTPTNRPSFVSVSGEVQFPNRLMWTNGMTLSAAIEAVHGLTAYADRSLFRVTRQNGESATFNFTDPTAMSTVGLQPGDKIFVPRSAAAPAVDVAAQAETPAQLYTRRIHVQAQGLLSIMDASTTDTQDPSDQQLLLGFLKSNGIALEPPAAAYLNVSNGTLTVRTSLENLDRIETLLSKLRD